MEIFKRRQILAEILLSLLILQNIFLVNSLLTSSVYLQNQGTINYEVTPPLPAGPLHTDGRWIKDANEEIVVLRGVNMGRFHTNPGGWIPYISDTSTNQLGFQPNAVKEQFDLMKSFGVNVVRWYTAISYWKWDTPDRGAYGAYPGPGATVLPDGSVVETRPSGPYGDHRQHIKDIAQWAGERGMYIVYAPWCVRGIWNPDPYHETLPFAPHLANYYYDDSCIVGSDQEFIDFWVDVANELKIYPNVIFEFFNEPHGDSTKEAIWHDVCQRTIDAIRATGSENLVVVQWDWSFWHPDNARSFRWIDTHGEFTGGNVVYSQHAYWHHGQLGIPEPVTYEEVSKNTHELLDPYVNRFPIWIGEYGVADINNPDNVQGVENFLKVLNEMSIGYAQWEFFSPLFWHMYNADGSPNAQGQIFINALQHASTIDPNAEGTISVSTSPVSGPIYLDGVYVGDGSYSGLHNVGQVTVSYGPVSGYTAPPPDMVLILEDQTTTVEGVYSLGEIQTFGKTQLGGTLDGNAANRLVGSRYSCPYEGNATSINVSWSVYSTNKHIKAAIYSDNNGTPGTLLAETGEYINSGTGILELELGLVNPIELTLGTYYWIIVNADYGGLYYDEPGTGVSQWAGYGTFPSPFPATTPNTRAYTVSINCIT